MRQSLIGILNFWRKTKPNKTAIVTPSCSITYLQLWEKARAFAEILMQRDCHFVGIATKSQEMTIIALIALMMCKKKFLILEQMSPYFKEIIKRSKIDAIIYDSDVIVDVGVEVIIIDDFCCTITTQNDLDYTLDMNYEVGAFLSSGTTGIPKMFIRSNYSLVSEAFLWVFELQLTSRTKFYISSPLSYIGGFVLFYSVLYAGGTIILNGLGKWFKEIKVTYAFYTVKEINDILDGYKNKSLSIVAKKVVTMGAPIDYGTKKRFADLYNCDIIEMWGNSEGLATIISMKDIHAKKGSIGRATFTDELFVTDKHGERLQPFKIGYISGITDNDTTSTTAEVIVSEDLGYMDNDEYFYLVGRENSVILLSDTEYFSANNFEKYLRKSGQVENCAITISSDRVHINVFFVSNASKNVKLLIDKYLASFAGKILLGKMIRLDRLPYNRNGKIDYYELNRLLNNK